MSIKKIAKAGSVVCSVSAIIAIVMTSGNVRTNQAGLELIGNAESCRRDPYVCPAGVLTDGIGNTHNVFSGKTDQQIARDWEKNISIAEDCVNRHFRGRSMSDNAFSAMTSAAFNVGCNGLQRYYSPARKGWFETSIHKYAQAGNWTMMCNHLPDFVNSGGKKLPGLVTRRDKEKALCLKAEQ